ncbi:MAG: DNA polymerase III subunit gamma/tau [Candidatus Izimaplasma sp.]|nr:DNA polymerase III subunit gamma/tau [Candidatus Izimaplasma bacterium]
MAYKALYRTYRPADFSEIAGQEHITRTFKNALKNNKLAHAYLFSGPRGTGKTSIAKIIAKAVNCEHAPVENPCNNCEICNGIDHNTINDVIEIDAASNNGVDEIREIRDKVKYLPGVGRYKVYIIDEVHMLSTGAFNALLKTLEEPPKHVIFILATTEPHKIPATIHSRCQRFDFRGVSVPEMIERLNTIIEEEKIEIGKQAIKVIAESAEGGMRDAISLLDQVVSYADQKVTIEDVHTIRGTVSNERLLDIALAIYENDSVRAIKILDELIDMGKESKRLVDNMIMFYRDMLIYKNTKTEDNDQLIFSNNTFIELTSTLSNNLIFYYIDVLNNTQNDMKWSNNAKLYMELALIKMVDKIEKQEIYFQDKIDQLTDKMTQLQQQVENQTVSQVVTQNTPEQEDEDEVSLETVIDEQQATSEETNEEEASSETEEQEPKQETKSNDEEEEKEATETIDDSDEETKSQPSLFNQGEELAPTSKETDKVTQVTEPEEDETPYQTYDIRYVEQVLNNGNREEKIAMNSKWFDIERIATAETMSLAKWITDGRIVATNGKMLIIEYANASLCNRMMKPDIKEKITEMLSDYFNKELDYLALPKKVWEEKSQEFIKKWKQNPDKDIKLSPINHPKLKEMPVRNQPQNVMMHEGVKEASQLYGKHKVKVKRGD